MITLFANNRLFNLLLLFAVCTSTLTSCDNEDAVITPTESAITDEQAAKLVETSLKADAQGLTASVEEAATLASDLQSADLTPCGTPTDSTFNFTRNTDYLQANYSVNLSWTALCGNNGLIRGLSYERTATGTYSTNRITSDDNATGSWTLDNIVGGGNSYVFSGSYERNGTQETTFRQTRSFQSNVQLEIANLNINKGSRRIESGQATFLLTGTNQNGQSFTVEGSVIFQGNGQAIVIINGNQFEVSL